MKPRRSWDREGPDPTDPFEWFNDGRYWYRMHAVPLTFHVSEYDKRTGRDINALLTAVCSSIWALWQDRRYKAVIIRVPRSRKHPGPEPTTFVGLTVVRNKDQAFARCYQMARDWDLGGDRSGGLTYDQMDAAIAEIRRLPGTYGVWGGVPPVSD